MRHKLISTVLACAVAAMASACSTTNPPAQTPTTAATTAAPPSPSLKAIKLAAPTSVAGLPAYRPTDATDLTVKAAVLRETLQVNIPASGQYIQDTYVADRKTISLAAVAAAGVTLEQMKKVISAVSTEIDGTPREVTFAKQGEGNLGCAPTVNASTLCAWFDGQSAGLVDIAAGIADPKGEAIKVYTQAVQR